MPVVASAVDGRQLRGLRSGAAMLIIVSGLAQVAMLWFRELTMAAVLDALVGTVYLSIGIGLLGRSRFSLFLAIVIPAAAAALWLDATPAEQMNNLQLARLAIDALVILSAAAVLWRVRKIPSV